MIRSGNAYYWITGNCYVSLILLYMNYISKKKQNLIPNLFILSDMIIIRKS